MWTSTEAVEIRRTRLGHLSLRLSRLVGALGAFARALAHRRDVRVLLELDDRALKDIGLVRSDVLGALAQPLIEDPSTILRARSVERRTIRHAEDRRQ